MSTRIQHRRDTAAAWTSANPVLASGEMGVETDTDKFKFGDGTTAWTSLAYASSGGTGGASTIGDVDGLQDALNAKVTGTGVTASHALTRTQFNAIGTKGASTVYLISSES